MSTEFIVVSVQLPKTLVDWFDQQVIQRRTVLLGNNHQDATLPTRSSIMRELLLLARSINPSGKV